MPKNKLPKPNIEDATPELKEAYEKWLNETPESEKDAIELTTDLYTHFYNNIYLPF